MGELDLNVLEARTFRDVLIRKEGRLNPVGSSLYLMREMGWGGCEPPETLNDVLTHDQGGVKKSLLIRWSVSLSNEEVDEGVVV